MKNLLTASAIAFSLMAGAAFAQSGGTGGAAGAGGETGGAGSGSGSAIINNADSETKADPMVKFGSVFYSDGEYKTMRSDTEARTNFAGLTAEDRTTFRSTCKDASADPDKFSPALLAACKQSAAYPE